MQTKTKAVETEERRSVEDVQQQYCCVLSYYI